MFACALLTIAVNNLDLPMMVENNTSAYGTGFTVTIEAAEGVTTGVSAADRITTVRAAIADGAKPSDLNRPGHVFSHFARRQVVYRRVAVILKRLSI